MLGQGYAVGAKLVRFLANCYVSIKKAQSHFLLIVLFNFI
jgi:hypothetical protein